MQIKSIKYYNFRNIKDGIVPFSGDDIILEGINGQGKTNILESVYTVCYGNSFRTVNSRDMIKIPAREMSLYARLEEDDETYDVIFSLEQGKRRISVNGREIRDRKDLIYLFPCIVFTHEDIDFIKGEPENRRRFFDQTMSMYDPVYLTSLRAYRAILEQRNAAIRNLRKDLLPFYNGRLASYGLELMKSRRNLVEEFNGIFPNLYRRISQTDKHITVSYRSSWDDFTSPEEVCEYLEENVERDMKMMTTTSGVHRDRFTVNDENGPLLLTGSTGQIRLASLLFRVAETQFFREHTGKDPILLLDDVLLELDSTKRAAFLSELSHYSQAFYTFLPNERYFDEREGHLMVYDVKGGCLEKRK